MLYLEIFVLWEHKNKIINLVSRWWRHHYPRAPGSASVDSEVFWGKQVTTTCRGKTVKITFKWSFSLGSTLFVCLLTKTKEGDFMICHFAYSFSSQIGKMLTLVTFVVMNAVFRQSNYI